MCGEYIYKGRKFNARKETTSEKYYSIPIIRFYIRCTRCSAELTFKTDPKNNDYMAEKGMKRNFEPWREAKLAEETEEERLDRLEREEAEADPMAELENKTMDAKTEMAIADKLDEIRTRNARMERKDREMGGADGVDAAAVRLAEERDEERERQEREDEAAAQAAFRTGTGEKVRRLVDEDDDGSLVQNAEAGIAFEGREVDKTPVDANTDGELVPPATFARNKKRKQDLGAALGIKKKKPPISLV